MKALVGNTYHIKDYIKSVGGRWNAQEKCWYVPSDKFDNCVSKLPKGVELKGQIWEECDICGDEPIYLNVGVCECCANKGHRR